MRGQFDTKNKTQMIYEQQRGNHRHIIAYQTGIDPSMERVRTAWSSSPLRDKTCQQTYVLARVLSSLRSIDTSLTKRRLKL